MLDGIKSESILKRIINLISDKMSLKLISYNKKLQKRLRVSLDDYTNYFNKIEIEIIPINVLKEGENIFINILYNRAFYHIYFDNDKNKIDRNYITKKDKVSKIKVILDMKIESLEILFQDCICIKEIKFIKCNRINITNMSNMFYGCESLNKINIFNLKTDNTSNMRNMFGKCFSLEELDLSKFKTDTVMLLIWHLCFMDVRN